MQDLHILDGALLLLEGSVDETESLFVRFGSRIRAGEPVAAPWIDVCQALVHLHRGELDAARNILNGSANTTEPAQNEYHIADRSLALGWLAWEERRWAEAADHLEQSLNLWRTGSWHTLAGGPLLLPLQQTWPDLPAGTIGVDRRYPGSHRCQHSGGCPLDP